MTPTAIASGESPGVCQPDEAWEPGEVGPLPGSDSVTGEPCDFTPPFPEEVCRYPDGAEPIRTETREVIGEDGEPSPTTFVRVFAGTTDAGVPCEAVVYSLPSTGGAPTTTAVVADHHRPRRQWSGRRCR